MTNEPHQLDRSYNVSHQEFVSGVRTGRVSLRVDGPGAYPFAASWSGAVVWYLTSWMNMVLTSPAVCIVILILTIALRDARIPLAIPAAIVIRGYDDAGNVIETHEHKGDFREP